MNSTQASNTNKPDRHGRWLLVIFAIATIAYLFVAMHIPLTIMVWQSYDDQLFMRLGETLADGRWLGPFDALTLAKAPGYPLFLAASHWTGLPVTFTQAAFYAFSLAALAWVIARKTGSFWLPLAIFMLLLWHPKVLEPARILRDNIYMSQSILLVALFSYCLFVVERRRQLWWGAVTGLLLGWFWITRDEGIWLVPGLAVLVCFAIFYSRGDTAGRTWWQPTLMAGVTFIAVLLLFMTVNFLTYGKFVGVDFKEKNFQAAISSMEGVQQAKPVPFVAVPRATRMQLYGVSPAFASLRPFLDPPNGHSAWEAGGCMFRPTACGDIGNGFFMWALRDAAEKRGHYRSPATASEFFGIVAKEIEAACADGRLICERDHIPLLPPMTDAQIAWIPVSLRQLQKTMLHPGAYPGFTQHAEEGTGERFASALEFLNHPSHYTKQDALTTRVDVTGWYYNAKSGNDWFELKVSDHSNPDLEFTLQRTDSPDLVDHFHDAEAARQRFRFNGQCGEGCTFHFTNAAGASGQLKLTDTQGLTSTSVVIGTGLMLFDKGSTVEARRTLQDDSRVVLAGRVNALLYRIYAILMPVLLVGGLAAFGIAGLLSIRRKDYGFTFVLACTCWGLVLSRAVILVLVDISSFPAMITPYLLPMFALAMIAALLSVHAASRLLLPGPVQQ